MKKIWVSLKKKLEDIAHNFNTLEEAVTFVLFDSSILNRLYYKMKEYSKIIDEYSFFMLFFYYPHFLQISVNSTFPIRDFFSQQFFNFFRR
ncbi:hypothetical protein [Leptotrichia buccalis]|uniref:hypothetical protein n=1 Tax=Leptotrichia buccalis TaxID=40542 RepID=UPI0009FD6134|nr:hypothetical protein [Leptotrichia buccalis]